LLWALIMWPPSPMSFFIGLIWQDTRPLWPWLGAPFAMTSASRVGLSSCFVFLFTASHTFFSACLHYGLSLWPFPLQLHEYKLQTTTVGRLSQFR
jgi:hypothetical protein